MNPYIKQFPDLMAGKKIMYVHGFLSSAQSGTVKMLQELMPNATLVAEDIPVHPEEGIEMLQKMQSGEIFIKGKKVDINSPSKAIENGIGLIPEDRKLHGLMLEKDVGFNLSICILETISKYCVVDFKTEEQKQREIIERLRIKLPHAGVLAKTLSGGNQQKVVLAKWLLAEADVLIFDEPTRGVDVGAKQEIYQLINELTDKGMAVIMVSSDMEELMGVPDRIIVLHEGECTGGLDKKDFSQVEILKLASGIQEKTS